MPPQSRGNQRPVNFVTSKSSPNLQTVRSYSQTERGRADQRTPPDVPQTNGSVGSDDDLDFSDDDDDGIEESEEAQQSPGTAFGRLGSFSKLHTTRSHPHLPPSSSQLFPPFYNRPPTPLPPSPSLTSLLRPSFSTQTSHHTTPESSDAESAIGTNATFPNSVSKSAASAAAPRAHPKVPTYEYYGFALYLASSGFFLMYLLWAYLPSPFLHQLGIYYYPDRWWALAIPCWLVVLVIYIYVTLGSYNTGHLTLPMSSSENIVDEAAQIAIVDKYGKIVRRKEKTRYEVPKKEEPRGRKSRQNSWQGGGGGGKEDKRELAHGKHYIPANLGHDVQWRDLWNEGTDAVMDIPIGGVCEILYGEGRQQDDVDGLEDGDLAVQKIPQM